MKKTPLLIIFLIVFIDLLGFGIVIPIIPSYAEKGFAASDVTVGFIVAAFSMTQLLFTPIWGRLSDRYGRKPIILLGLVITVISYLIFGLAASLPMLFLSRLLGGVGGANISAAQAYIADVTGPADRAKGMGLIGAAFGLGFVFGPFLGGLLVAYGYAFPGFAAAGLSTLALITAAIFMPESHSPGKDTEIQASTMSVKQLTVAIQRPQMGILLLLFFLVTFGFANIYATFPLISTRAFGFSDREVGYLFGFLGIIGAVTQGGLIRPLSARFDERWLFFTGTLLTMAGLVLLPFYVSTPVLLVELAIMSLGTGLMTPAVLSLISRAADSHEQGGILGVNQALGSLGRVLGPVCGAYIFHVAGNAWPFLTGGVVMAVVALLIRRRLWIVPNGGEVQA